MSKEEEFIKLYSFDKKNYPMIEKELNINRKEIQKLFTDTKIERNNIQKIRNKFQGKKKEGFNQNFEFFYKWYKSQEKKCGYCGTSENTLKKLFESKKLTSKKFTATLHIERRNPNGEYNEENCMLACSLCNNAKSDLINEDNYREYFEKCMNQFLKDLSDGLIENREC